LNGKRQFRGKLSQKPNDQTIAAALLLGIAILGILPMVTNTILK